MITPKTEEELKVMQEGGAKLVLIKEAIREMLAPGITGLEVDKKAEDLLLRAGGTPSFKTVRGYHWATCINVNDGVVHGVPNDKAFKDGDLVKVDLGFFYKGMHTDTAFTHPLGDVGSDKLKFLEVGRQALNNAIEETKLGNRVSDISKAMQKVIEKAGYSPARSLTGHGIGRELHEEPQVPCLWQSGKPGELLVGGTVLAIEAIYTLGSPELDLSKADNWTIATKDGKIAGYFEETVAVTANGPLILTA